MVESNMKHHVSKLGLMGDGIEDRIARLSTKTSSYVKISVHAATEYKLCTTDPQGEDGDTWAVISSTFLQTFRISGDRIVRGEEIVRVHVSECPELVTTADHSHSQLTIEEQTLSPSSMRRTLGRIVRNRAETG